MKKYITFLFMLVLLPLTVFAAPESNTLEEALKEEGISANLEGYTEDEGKVPVYLFRGRGCSHCYEFLEYVSSSLVKSHGDKFRLVSYEVWYNEDNSNLMSQVSNHFKDNASGVPYIVIGDKTWNGYAESMNSEIEEAIDNQAGSEEKFDVLKDADLKTTNTSSKAKKGDSTVTVVSIIIAVVAILAILLTYFRKQTKEA